MLQRRPSRVFVRLAAALALLATPALAGCVDDPAPHAGPLSLVEAHALALRDARRYDPAASLAAFVGHDGPAPRHLSGLLAVAGGPGVAEDGVRGDGRTSGWSILFATPRGELLRTTVQATPLVVHTEPVAPPPGVPVATIWSLNLGGRLVVDTSAAAQIVRTEDPVAAGLWAARPDLPVLYASTIVPQYAAGGPDLAHLVQLGYGEPGSDPFAHFALVGHYTGVLLESGDAAAHAQARTMVLVDETFTLTPLAPSAEASRQASSAVSDVVWSVEASGVGRYEIQVLRDNETMVARASGIVAVDPVAHHEALGRFVAGAYTLRAQADGWVTFTVRITGSVA